MPNDLSAPASGCPHTQAASYRPTYDEMIASLGGIQNPEAAAKAAQEATIAQKNLRLASITRERNRLKDRIAVLKGQKKRTSDLVAELSRLTRLELELEGGR